MDKLERVFATKHEPYMNHEQINVYYTKNNKDDHAVFMNYGKGGENKFQLVEDSGYGRKNMLNQTEWLQISDDLNKGKFNIL